MGLEEAHPFPFQLNRSIGKFDRLFVDQSPIIAQAGRPIMRGKDYVVIGYVAVFHRVAVANERTILITRWLLPKTVGGRRCLLETVYRSFYPEGLKKGRGTAVFRVKTLGNRQNKSRYICKMEVRHT